MKTKIAIAAIFIASSIFYLGAFSPPEQEIRQKNTLETGELTDIDADLESNNSQVIEASVEDTITEPPTLLPQPAVNLEYRECQDYLESSEKRKESFTPKYLHRITKIAEGKDFKPYLKAALKLEGSYFAYDLLNYIGPPSTPQMQRQENIIETYSPEYRSTWHSLSEIPEEVADLLQFTLHANQLYTNGSRETEPLENIDTITYSRDGIRNLLKLSDQDRQRVLSIYPLVVDDLDTAINSLKLRNNDIIKLMSYVKDINGRSAFSVEPDLLENILKSGDRELFEAYLDHGGKLHQSDWVNPLEYFLHRIVQVRPLMAKRIKINFNNEPADIAYIIKKMVDAGLTVRVEETDDGETLVGVHSVLEVDQAYLDAIAEFSVPTESATSAIEASYAATKNLDSIIWQLKSEKEALNNELYPANHENIVGYCTALITSIDNKIQTQKVKSVRVNYLKPIDEPGYEDQYIIDMDKLKKDNPLVAECGIHSQWDYSGLKQKFSNKNMLEVAIRNHYYTHERVQAFADYLKSYPEDSAIMYKKVIENYDDHVDILVDNNIVPSTQNLLDMTSVMTPELIKKLEVIGAFKHHDVNERIAYMLMQRCDAPSFNALLNQNVLPKGNQFPSAALYMALHFPCDSVEKQVSMIASSLSLEPKVRDIHHGPIAAFKLKSPKRYQALVESFPQLTVENDVPASLTEICQLE